MNGHGILINRTPVLTLWAAIVAERLGFKHDEALSLGKAVAGLNAQSKGRHLGIFKPVPAEVKKARAQKRGDRGHVPATNLNEKFFNTGDGEGGNQR
jgi:hypothetical protein